MNLTFVDMSNTHPKLSSIELVSKMTEKGIMFNKMSEADVIHYLNIRNNYFRTASYRKNYEKHDKGENKDKYIDLDFAYLAELSTIDMHLRFLIIKMCLDIEHCLKVKMLSDIASNADENGYAIVADFLRKNEWIVDDICRKQKSSYIGDLTNKYFTFDTHKSSSGNIVFDNIEIRCPIWALMEIITFGQFLLLYDFYYSQQGNNNLTGILNTVKSLRNACAHNNCVIHNLRKGYTKPSARISNFISKIKSISKDDRRNKLSVRPLYELVTLLYLYDYVVFDTVKESRYKELDWLVNERMIEHADYFEHQQIISAAYIFLKKVVDFLI